MISSWRKIVGVKENIDEAEAQSLPNKTLRHIYESRFIFEIAWEVVNKVGGIYTVLRTKAAVSVEELGSHYCLLGPLNETCMRTEMEVCDPPCRNLYQTVTNMREQGLYVVFGRWLIEGYPYVVLFDIRSAASRLHEWKYELWQCTGICVPDHDRETNDAIIFGAMVAWFLGEFQNNMSKVGEDAPILGHFHEWLAGVGLIFTRVRQLDVATVFTTHATLLGRYLCAGSADLYNHLPFFNCDKEAGDRQIYHRYCLERAAASCAHVLTTVSKVTGMETEHLLKRKADVITPNGLNVVKFAASHEFQNKHSVAKDKIHHFIQGHFHGNFNFNLDKTLYLFIAGRYEFQNKGADIFIEALARLNHQLKSMGSDTTVVAFLIFPTTTNNFNVESFRSQAIVKQLRETVTRVKDAIGHRLFDQCLRGQIPKGDTVLTEADIVQLKRCVLGAHRTSLPPITTHNIINDDKDPVLVNLRRCQLFNGRDDRVKVIFHPEFLTSSNPLLPIDYEEFVAGCHMGVFPSYYEPWGYTPAECTVMGIPSVTTSVSGFGTFMMEHVESCQGYGIFVVERIQSSTEDVVRQLTKYLLDFSQLSRRQRVILRNRTERLSELLDWKNLYTYYRKARFLAFQRHYPKLFISPPTASNSPGSVDEHFEQSFHVTRVSSPESDLSALLIEDDIDEKEEEDSIRSASNTQE